jgi:HEPN domain-containing protein
MGEDTASRWFGQAKWDLKAARDSEAAGNYEWACFQAQQAAEKALKAFLLAAGSMPPLTHSIRTLLSECAQADERFGQINASIELEGYYVGTRYPDSLPGNVPHMHYDEEAAQRCLSLASSVIEFVTRLTKS